MKTVKQFEASEEGFCKVTLTSKKVFDPYLLTMIEKEPCALSCRSKGNSTTIFYYDTCEHIPLLTLLSKYEFDDREACACIEHLYSELERLDREYPLLVRSDSIFYDPVAQRFSFVIVPVTERDFEIDWNALIKDIITHIQLPKAAFYGFLSSLQTQLLLPSQFVSQCHVWQLQHTALKRLQLWWRHLVKRKRRRQENEQRIQEELIRLRFIRRSSAQDKAYSVKNKRTTSDTVVLFPGSSACLKDLTGNRYPLGQETQIGRNEQNDIVLNFATVSAKHALIKQSAQGMVLVDLGSSNGTKVNNKKLKKHQERLLKNGDTILFADSCWYYEEEV